MVNKPFEKPPPDLPPEHIPLFKLELNPIPNGFVSPEAFEKYLKSPSGRAFVRSLYCVKEAEPLCLIESVPLTLARRRPARMLDLYFYLANI